MKLVATFAAACGFVLIQGCAATVETASAGSGGAGGVGSGGNGGSSACQFVGQQCFGPGVGGIDEPGRCAVDGTCCTGCLESPGVCHPNSAPVCGHNGETCLACLVPGCITADDCPASPPCYYAICPDGGCDSLPVPDGTSCGNGNACTDGSCFTIP